MATNPLIPLMTRVPDIGNSLLQGQNIRANFDQRRRDKVTQPMQDKMNQLNIQGAEQDLAVGQRQEQSTVNAERIAAAQRANAHARLLKSLPREKRRQVHDEHEKLTGTADDIIDPVEEDEYLDTLIAATDSLMNGQELTTEQKNALFATGGNVPEAQELVRGKLEEPHRRLNLQQQEFGLKLAEFAQKNNGTADFKDVQALRKEYVKTTETYAERASAISTLIATANDTSGASDVALITAFMKVLDPGSVVREGEFANVARAQGLSDRLISIGESVDKGRIISDAMREDILSSGRNIFKSAETQFAADQKTFSDISEANGFPVEQVVIPRGSLPDQAATPTGKTATNPTTGARVQQMSDGTWVPINE